MVMVAHLRMDSVALQALKNAIAKIESLAQPVPEGCRGRRPCQAAACSGGSLLVAVQRLVTHRIFRLGAYTPVKLVLASRRDAQQRVMYT